jgi:hypothetical protein
VAHEMSPWPACPAPHAGSRAVLGRAREVLDVAASKAASEAGAAAAAASDSAPAEAAAGLDPEEEALVRLLRR